MDKKLKSEIREALGLLDVNNPDHWTTDGLPRLDVLSDLTKKEIKRKQVTEVAPEFSLTNPVLEADDGKEGEDDSWLDEKPAEEAAGEGEKPAEGAEGVKNASPAPAVPQAPAKAAPAPVKADGYGDADLAALDADISSLTEKIARDKGRLDALAKEVAATEQALSRKIDEKNRAFPPMTAAQAVRHYISTQHEQRAGRAEAANRLRQLAGTSVIQGKAPIDAAMARKTGRGAQRPYMALSADTPVSGQ